MTKLIPLDAAIAAITIGHTVTQHEKALRAIPAIGLREAAQMMLEIHDGFMAGRDVDMTDAKTLALASAFGAQAFAVCPMHDAAPSAMTRAFLLALIDPMHPDLDYLRAQNVARLVSDEALIGEKK